MDRAGVGFRMVHARCVCVVSGWFTRVASVWFQDGSRALRLLHTLFLL